MKSRGWKNLSARDGEITGLIGPNDAGKTTILRILYTVLRPDRGSAKVDELRRRTGRQDLEEAFIRATETGAA